MRNALRLSIVVAAVEVLASGGSLAADQTELDLFYSSKLVGEPTSLQVGPNKKHIMRRFELTAIDGTSFVGTTTALCNQIKLEDNSTTPNSFSYDAHCAWKDAEGDLIFETYNGGISSENSGSTTFGSGLIVGGTGKYKGITGGFAWSHDEKRGRKRGLYYLPGG